MQPPSGGCVLKQLIAPPSFALLLQPPSGGCVLKLWMMLYSPKLMAAAAFGRLCVET